MKRLSVIIPIMIITFLLFNFTLYNAQGKSPIDVVNLYDSCYGRHCMDEIADLTTPIFRNYQPKSVWVVDTWKALNLMGYERLSSSIVDSKIKDDKAIVLMEAKIKTVAGETIQKEIYYLIKEDKEWLIDDLTVTDEEVDLEKMRLEP